VSVDEKFYYAVELKLCDSTVRDYRTEKRVSPLLLVIDCIYLALI